MGSEIGIQRSANEQVASKTLLAIISPVFKSQQRAAPVRSRGRLIIVTKAL
jgi:hypothetical protein